MRHFWNQCLKPVRLGETECTAPEVIETQCLIIRVPVHIKLEGAEVYHSSVQSLSCVRLWNPRNHSTPGLRVHHWLPVPPNPCPLSQWYHPTISSSVVPLSSCPQSFPESGSFPMSQLFASGGQSIAASASTSVLPMNIQNWSPLGWTGWISLLSKGLSRVFSNTTVQKHQFFSTQLSL